ncbi:hypothetical protein G7076_01965 [Sphingomonas sp. HDW15A]|uniref:hypothetical protein n=1 Tax=Sphingomonas sp. HDW15A TaxID=2714942 RepID=UPI001409D7EE|nr:hypothetical protein [Sphingomonas sp. HDW15A]QIK95414.1 hypothetical protein G7076_01965 [Sphingomonas sp. HDW15A]
MRKLTISLLVAGTAILITGCDKKESAAEANTAVVEETVPPSESADNLDSAAANLDNAAENVANATDNAAVANATDQGSTDH